MDRKSLHTIAWGIVVVIVIASAVVVAASQYLQAEQTKQDIAAVEDELSGVRSELTMTESDLAYTEQLLEGTHSELATTQEILADRTTQRNDLSARMTACRRLIRINDYLLFGERAQSSAIGYLMQGRNTAASRALGNASRYFRGVQQVAKNNGYRDISQLVEDCSPTVLTETVSDTR